MVIGKLFFELLVLFGNYLVEEWNRDIVKKILIFYIFFYICMLSLVLDFFNLDDFVIMKEFLKV